MRKLLFFILLPITVLSQNTIGLPDVFNYSKHSYKAGLQNWDIKQDKNGIIYFANNEGLLSYDGNYWNLYPLPNKTIVRSIEIGLDNKIYVGGQDEFGYFYPEKNGQLKYHSLIDIIEVKDKNFGDVWDIIAINKDVFFRSANKIFKISNNAYAVYNANFEWTFLGKCNGKLYAHDLKKGLLVFENQVWIELPLKSDLPQNNPITSILSLKNDSALITTLKQGLFVLSKEGIKPIVSVNNNLFKSKRIYAATAVNSEAIALATSNSGVYVIDFQGNIIQSFAKTEGIQNNNVLSVFVDNQNSLWLGLDNGIDLIAYNSAIKHINPNLENASGYTALMHNNQLFVGTSNGLFSVPLQPMKDLSFSKGNFVPVSNTTGQTWGLSVINNQILLGQHEGAFIVNNNAASKISEEQGFWNFVPLSNTFPTAQMVAGNYKGLLFFDFLNQQFVPSKQLPDFNESSRFIAIDKENNIWISHPYHGVYKIIKNADGSYKTNTYNEKNGLPNNLNNHVFSIKNEVVIATEKGIYTYNKQKNNFEPSPYYKNILGNQSIRYLKEDVAGNIWFIHEKNLGVIDFSDANPRVIYLPELNNKMLSGFEFIYPINDNNIFLGSENGIFHINYNKYKQNVPTLQVNIRSVRIINQIDSLIFGGYANDIIEKISQTNSTTIDNSWKTISIEFSSPLFGYQSNLEYSYRLKGFEKNWSEWTKRTEKEYTNLPEGNYQFEVKVRNNLGNESPVAVYVFKMLPPWYQTLVAKIIYVFIAIASFYFLYKWQKNKFILQQKKYEEEQKKLSYIHDLEINKTESKLVALHNEKLEADINFKNTELASNAMHLVKKGELLTRIKSELNHIMKGIDNPTANAELKKMIKALSEDDNMDKEWEHFSKHFDKVHSDFLVELKEKHPTITPNELKLSAYLRMNLSTKEIAQLLNISVRGVEISRYRLRKKLEIQSDTSLFDYLISNFSSHIKR